ncbi:MAG: biotin--[acetyl-CoA-carboxylase] ligase [Actinomycetota bacterium]|nr:biotin--[acetyl-CoA-carboxylase] ligase [Actinomycetota bacterium]
MPDALSKEAISAACTGRFGHAVRFFEDIASTNTEALEWASDGGPEGALVVADHQTGGRGRWGRTWFSVPGKLLQFSLILRPRLELDRHGLLTGGLGVACADAIGATSGLPTKVKWPNDVVVDGRKLVGMLVETQTIGSTISAAVCGIGVNVSLERSDLPDELAARASSIAIEMTRAGLGSPPSRLELLSTIVARIEALYPALVDPARHHEIVGAMTERSQVLGTDIVIKRADGTVIEGYAKVFDETGGLVLKTSDGTSTQHLGEIEQLR